MRLRQRIVIIAMFGIASAAISVAVFKPRIGAERQLVTPRDESLLVSIASAISDDLTQNPSKTVGQVSGELAQRAAGRSAELKDRFCIVFMDNASAWRAFQQHLTDDKTQFVLAVLPPHPEQMTGSVEIRLVETTGWVHTRKFVATQIREAFPWIETGVWWGHESESVQLPVDRSGPASGGVRAPN